MSEFISVPRAMVESHLYAAAFPAQINVYSHTDLEYITATYETFNYDSFTFHCVYKQEKQSLLDKLINRKRYKLVYVHNPILGSQGTTKISKEDRNKMRNISELDLDYKARDHRMWHK